MALLNHTYFTERKYNRKGKISIFVCHPIPGYHVYLNCTAFTSIVDENKNEETKYLTTDKIKITFITFFCYNNENLDHQ